VDIVFLLVLFISFHPDSVTRLDHTLAVGRILYIFSILTMGTFADQRCGTCDAIFPTLMALEAHQEEADHWSSDDEDEDDDDKDVDGRRDLSEDSQLDTEDEMELDCKDRQLKKERLFLI
jgi:hypothetical protein